jgi:hypothetical protein
MFTNMGKLKSRTACQADQLSSSQEGFHSKKYLSDHEVLYEVGIQEIKNVHVLGHKVHNHNQTRSHVLK